MIRRGRIITIWEFGDRGFEQLFAKLDRLHDLASEGHLTEATPLSPSNVVGWLEDIIFTAEETIREIDAHAVRLHAFSESEINHGG